MRTSASIAPLGILMVTLPAWGQPPPRLTRGEELVPALPPVIYQATAAEAKGEVQVRLSCPSGRITGKKDARGVTVIVAVWEDMKPLTLGNEVQAYSRNGKPLKKKEVLKALAKRVSVVCFVRSKTGDPLKPDPFYAAMFKKDAVLLMFLAKDLRR